MFSEILKNCDLFEYNNVRETFKLIGTDYYYYQGSYIRYWASSKVNHGLYIKFEDMFDIIMRDSKIPDNIKNNILFNLNELKQLVENGIQYFGE